MIAAANQDMTLEQFADWLYSISQRAKRRNTRDIMEKIVAPMMREAIEDNFMAARTPDGVPWPPRKHSYPHPPLRDTLAMMNSLVEPDAPGGWAIIEDNFVTLGSDVESPAGYPYPVAQNYGTNRIDAREFAGVSDDWLDRIEGAIADALEEAVLEGVS